MKRIRLGLRHSPLMVQFALTTIGIIVVGVRIQVLGDHRAGAERHAEDLLDWAKVLAFAPQTVLTGLVDHLGEATLGASRKRALWAMDNGGHELWRIGPNQPGDDVAAPMLTTSEPADNRATWSKQLAPNVHG